MTVTTVTGAQIGRFELQASKPEGGQTLHLSLGLFSPAASTAGVLKQLGGEKVARLSTDGELRLAPARSFGVVEISQDGRRDRTPVQDERQVLISLPKGA